MRRRLALVALALAVSTALSGCVSMFVPAQPTATSTPTGERVDRDLQSFYDQRLVWSPCADGFQCTTAAAPLDWSDPARADIELALIRSTATADRLGSLLVNPGGPGASGVELVRDSLDFAVSERLQGAYDIVGFDPRGVGDSSAVDCYDDPSELDSHLFDLPEQQPGTAAYLDEIESSTAAFGAACLEHTGELLQFVDTVSAARDLDLLRAVLGDEKLNYLGYSYGTFLGATFAELYPTKTGHLVLDGAIDPTTSDFDVTATQAQGFESALRAYLTDCLGREECPFDGSVDTAMTDVRALLDRLERSPLRNSDGRELDAGGMSYAIITPLYSASTWSYLDQVFADVESGDPAYAFQLVDSYYQRTPNGTYLDNSTEAFTAINCLDYRVTATVEQVEADAAELARLAPVFGPEFAYGGRACAEWPFPSTRDRVAIAASGSAPILVVGTTNDPATPYVWAQSLSAQLENGHLVTYRGEGHTAYNKSNACVDDAVDAFFLRGTVPADDPIC